VSGAAHDWLGSAVRFVGDIDKDGSADFIATAPRVPQVSNLGYAHVFSGRSGTRIRTFEGICSTGEPVAGAGDVDRDGYPDLIIAHRCASPPDRDVGGVFVYSGKNGRILHAIVMPGPGSGSFGYAVDGTGDVNQDGHPDILIGEPSAPPFGRIAVHSGKDGSLLYERFGVGSGYFGASVSGPGDLDGDGIPDVIAGAPHPIPQITGPGYVMAFSGSTGFPLHQWHGSNSGDVFGFMVAGAGDVNGDGRNDVIVCATQTVPQTQDRNGYFSVLSGANVSPMGAGCGLQPLPVIQSAIPRVGMPWTLQGRNAPGNGFGLVLLSEAPGMPTPLGAGCSAFLAVTRLFSVATVTSDAAGNWQTTAAVPSDPPLIGLELATQTALLPGRQALPFELTHGLYMTVTR
jgi:hypothetical protein